MSKILRFKDYLLSKWIVPIFVLLLKLLSLDCLIISYNPLKSMSASCSYILLIYNGTLKGLLSAGYFWYKSIYLKCPFFKKFRNELHIFLLTIAEKFKVYIFISANLSKNLKDSTSLYSTIYPTSSFYPIIFSSLHNFSTINDPGKTALISWTFEYLFVARVISRQSRSNSFVKYK